MDKEAVNKEIIHVGVSACVVGDKVRFDGGHKKSGYVSNYLGETFHLVPVCPEVGMGMPVPRPAIRIIEDEGQEKLVDSKDSAIDHTSALNRFYDTKSPQFAKLDGYIFCAKSPTCGVERIKVYTSEGDVLHRKGMGLFSKRLKEQYPLLPIEEDGRLNDLGLRESFVTKVYVHHHFRNEVMNNPSMGALVKFHSKHKFLVMAYSPKAYQQLGRLVATGKKVQFDTLMKEYLGLLLGVLSKPTNRKKHTNVLMHLQGFLKKQLSKEDKQELSDQIERYRLGYIPLMAPITLLQHHLKHHPNEYLSSQVYLEPYPESLGIRA
ncbi:DUF523 and DUF1722 domain-containing protein [Aestuariibacter sp. AA17]|uniref:DUF523 and DUF1722 domain-containing protein n=1 Tax=Fluctibacter corallii TaxID=2984329 RepID=A0ABT3A9K5_9ALTE|nr:DUF523 and DUF1722 domain-containing protein [Aestuariibacter sp. AA17]MCV2885351.1 DUF523 and DUF1722 domain-containing protein [Aestuariibacter sp. AA17]